MILGIDWQLFVGFDDRISASFGCVFKGPNFGMVNLATASTELTRRTATVFLFREHLEAALAHGEALAALNVALGADLVTGASVPTLLRQNRKLETVVEDARCLELALALRLVQARRCAVAARQQDPRLKPLLSLFDSGTRAVDDAASDSNRNAREGFASGGAARAYAISRALLADSPVPTDDAARLGPIELELDRLRPNKTGVGDDFLLFGSIHLGTLMDLISTTLDALDRVQEATTGAAE
jgi:hypothetical protein